MPKLDDQISTLQSRLQQLKMRQQRIEARKRAVTAIRDRKVDTRRKILLGGLVLEKMREGAMDRAQIAAWLDETLSRAADRALFDLPSRANGDPTQPSDPTKPVDRSEQTPGP